MFTTKNLIILIGKQALVTLVAIGSAFVAISFLAREITRISDTVVQNRQLTDKLAKRTELFSLIAHDISVVKENDVVLLQAFPPADEILEFIRAFEDLALKHGATQLFRFSNPVPAPDISPFPLSTISYQNSLTMNVSTLSNYLKDFEKLPYYTRIDGISVVARDASGWTKDSTVTYRAIIYTKTPN